MKNKFASVLFVMTATVSIVGAALISPPAHAKPPSAKVFEACLEPAAEEIAWFLESEGPDATITIVRDSQGAAIGFTEKDGIYEELKFSKVFTDGYDMVIYVFRSDEYYVLAEVRVKIEENGTINCHQNNIAVEADFIDKETDVEDEYFDH